MSSLEPVLNGGFCVGCGACAVLPNSAYRLEFSSGGYVVQAGVDKGLDEDFGRVCPFSDSALNEDSIAHELFGAERLPRDERIGFYRRIGAAYVNDQPSRLESSSGGIATWVLNRLLDAGDIDGVIHVRPRQPCASDPRLFSYVISRTPEEVNAGRSSHYYPVSMAEVLQAARSQNGRYALVGIPCFIKAARLLARHDPEIGRRIKFMVGLVCGHLKFTAMAAAV